MKGLFRLPSIPIGLVFIDRFEIRRLERRTSKKRWWFGSGTGLIAGRPVIIQTYIVFIVLIFH